MEINAYVIEVIESLEKCYGAVDTELNYHNSFELLIAVILSAQTTDKQVNIVTEKLFKAYPDALSLSRANQGEIESILKTIGLYRRKAKSIIDCAYQLVTDYNGLVPCERQELMKLPGVGRKTANVVLAIACNQPALPVDTHVYRLAHRLGFSRGKTPQDVEQDLMKICPDHLWNKLHLLLITHGRRVCKARNPLCSECLLKNKCPSFEHSLDI